jgi:EAL domain-containing protein (putative c-di-GMP-specific phosphodiesterase class I)
VRYQPIIDLESGELVALEALARWQHPTRGLLSPAEFVELAEETGQVEAMDHSMIRLACKEFGSLLSQHPEAAHLRLNVNLSLQHLSVVRLREMLGEVLAQGRILPRQLVVEVTESADLSSEDFTGLLTAVTDLGVGVAIDDFGTGFSALSRLRGLLIDSIKVDRSFITNVHTHAHSHAIVAAVIQLAAALDATVVAEGIELPEQLSALRSLGCAKGQGWLWSPAVTITEIGQHVAARRTTGWAPYWRVGVPAQRAPAQPRSQLSKEEPVSVS